MNRQGKNCESEVKDKLVSDRFLVNTIPCNDHFGNFFIKVNIGLVS